MIKKILKNSSGILIAIFIIMLSYSSGHYMGIFDKFTTLEAANSFEVLTHLKNFGKYTFFIISNVILLQYIILISKGDNNGSNDTE